MDNSPDYLPEGWTVETRIRKSGPKIGGTYKCYIAPVTGVRFWSKRKVSEYLAIGNLRNTCRLKRRPEIDVPSSSQVCAIVECTKKADEELPPGWTKITKFRKTGDKARKDSYYVDPAARYVFRSRKDAFRYLQTGEIRRLALKPKNGCFSDFEFVDKNSTPTAAKRQGVENGTNKRCLSSGQSSKTNEKIIRNEILEPFLEKEHTTVFEHSQIQSTHCAKLSSFISPKFDNSNKMPGRELSSTLSLVTALPATISSSEEQHQKNLTEGEKQSGNKKTQIKSSRNSDNTELSFPRRTSKRLAGISPDPVPDLKIRKRKSQVSHVLEANPSKEVKISESADQVPEQVDQICSNRESKPTISSTEGRKVPAECENQHDKSTHKDGNILLIEEQTRIHAPENQECAKNAKKANEKQNLDEFRYLLPFGDSWPDPCIEFAFKTLTGAIPVEDNLVIEDYFLHQLGSSAVQNHKTNDLILPDTEVDVFSQASELFPLDTSELPLPARSPSSVGENSGKHEPIRFGGN